MTLGLLFALIALGFMLIVGVMEVINLAHGSLFALGAYFAYAIIAPRLPLPRRHCGSLGRACRWRGGSRQPSLLAPVLVAPFGLVLELCLRRTYGKRSALWPAADLRRRPGAGGAIRLVWGTREQCCPCRVR